MKDENEEFESEEVVRKKYIKKFAIAITILIIATVLAIILY